MLDLQKFQNEFLFINFSSSEDALTQLKLILGATKLSDFLANSAHHVYFYPERSWGLGAYNNKALSFLYKAAYTDGSYKYKELNKTELNDKRPNEKCIQYLCEAVFKQLSDENAENEFSKIGGIELLLQILKDEQEFKSLSEQERLAISADFETTDSEELVSKKFKKKYRDNFLNLFKHLKNHYELLKLILSQENSELFEAFGTSLVEWLNKDNLTSVQIYELLNIILNSKNSMLYLKVIPHFQNKLPWEIISSNEINLLLMQSVDKVILSKNTGIFEGQTKPLLEKLPLSNLGAAGAHALLKKLTTEVLRLLKVNGTNRAFALQLFEKTVVPFVNKLPVDELSSQDVYELLFELNQFVLDKKDNEVFEKCVMPLLLKLPLSKLSSEHCFNLLNPLKDKILSNNDLASMGVYAQPLFDRFPVENLTTDDCYKLLEPVMKKVVEQNKQDLFNYTILLVLRRVKIDDPENLGLTTKQCLDLIDHVLKSKYAHHLFASCVIPVLEKLPEDKQESLTNSFIGKDEKTLGSESTVVENKYFALLKPFVEEQNSKHFHRFAGKILNKAVTAKKHKLSAENYSELLKLAIEKGNIEIALTLFGHFDKYPRGAKDRADDLLDYMFSTNCKYDYPIFAELIFNEFPALLTCVDDDGNTWLHLAASRPGQLSRFLLTNKDTVEKINVNQKNRNGETALHIAAKAGNTPMVRKLISSGDNVFFQYAQGRTSLDLAK
ncbi:MAG: ankyrin repeat domain-containing protein, partial [Gammaproteobacteria bacterium]